MDQAIATRLSSVSWDFADASSKRSLHSIHPFPAKFIPEIPRALIRLFPPDAGCTVFDPFCGSGTTLVEALCTGREAVGVDLNPLATLISKVKTTPVRDNLLGRAEQVVHAARSRVDRGAVDVPRIPRLDHWFQKPIQLRLAALVEEINALSDVDVVDALRIALSSTIVRVSNQESDTRYAAIQKAISPGEIWTLFSRSAQSMAESLGSMSDDLFGARPPVRIITKDILSVEPADIGDNVGLVVTSPPYPNAYEYWLYHKYRMYWLGMDPVAVRSKEIGARPHYFKKNHQTEDDFECQMGRCFWLLSRVMRRGGHACFVVGRSIIHGREIDNGALLERAALPWGFRKMGSAIRRIATTRKSGNPRHGSIEREGILVFMLEPAR